MDKTTPWDVVDIPYHSIFHHQGNLVFHGIRIKHHVSCRDRHTLVATILVRWRSEWDRLKVHKRHDQRIEGHPHVWEFAPKHKATRRYNSESSQEKCNKMTWSWRKWWYLHNKENYNPTGRDRITYFRSFLTKHTSCRNWKDHSCLELRMLTILDIITFKIFVILQ